MNELGSLGWVALVNGIVWGGLGWYAWRLGREAKRAETGGDPSR